MFKIPMENIGQHFLSKLFLKIRHYLLKQSRINPYRDLLPLVINVTTRCNFNCPHCLRKPLDINKTFRQDISIELFEEILDGAKKLGYQKINFTGGEPILHPNFQKLVELACQYGYYFTIVSNGWFYERYWPIISQNRWFLSIAFSIDGATADVHDRIRNQPGSFQRAIEAIKFYKKKKVREVIMATCLTKQNRHQVSEIIRLGRNLKVDVINLFAPVSISNNQSDCVLNKQDRKDILNKIRENKSILAEQKILLQIGSAIRLIAPNRANFCYNVMRPSFYIDPTGGMQFCCDIPKMPADRPNILKDGFLKSFLLTLDIVNEIKKQRLKDIWGSENHPDNFYTCEYCNQNIESIIKKVRAKDKN